MAAIEVNWSRDGGILVARPVGRIYSSSYLDWQIELERGIGPEDTALVVEFAQVPYLSSAGLRVLLTMSNQFQGPGQHFAICALTRGVAKVVGASGLDSVLDIYDSAEEAVAGIRAKMDGAAES